MEINWRNLAEAYHEAYVTKLAEQGQVVEEKFSDLTEEEIKAVMAGVEYACYLFGAAVRA